MMQPTYVIIERITRTAPFGIRFYDRATGRVATGLTVTAATADPAAAVATSAVKRTIPLVAGPSGVYNLRGLPGLITFENGDGTPDFWANLPPARRYTLSVQDERGEFLPFTLAVDLPMHGLFAWECEPLVSPPQVGSHMVPLFSAPARAIPAGYIAVRADLYDPIADAPAAWAVVEITYQGQVLGRGLADSRGCVVVPLAYPPPIDYEPLSPEVTGAALTDQRWTVGLRAWYRGGIDSAQPDLCAVLDQLNDPPARVWKTWTSPPGEDWLAEDELHYGRDLILRTGQGGAPLPQLYIAPME
jgi:hypothetical protein